MGKKLFWSRDRLDKHEFDCLGLGLGLGLRLPRPWNANFRQLVNNVTNPSQFSVRRSQCSRSCYGDFLLDTPESSDIS